MRNLEESRNFTKRPEQNQIVKVYYKVRNREPEFGVVLRIEQKYEREIVILKKTVEKFDLSEVDFCLDAYKIEFEDKIIKKKK